MAWQRLVVGAFARPRDAVDVLRALRVNGIPAHQIGLAHRTGEILHTSGILAGVGVPEHDLAGALIGLGLTVRQALHYRADLERGWAIVTAQADARQVREMMETFASTSDRSCQRIDVQQTVPVRVRSN
jgi:hypothetical protein